MITKVSEPTINKTVLETTCPFCGGKNDPIEVRSLEFFNFQVQKHPVQKAFPSLTESQRENILTGICDPCFKLMSETSDDDEWDD